MCPGCQYEMTPMRPGDTFVQTVAAPLPHVPSAPPPPALPKLLGPRIAPYLYLFSTVIFAGVLALDPVGRFFIAPLIFLVVVVASLFLAAMFAGRRELGALVSNRKERVTHGLEHGCLGILVERGHVVHSGATLKGKFSITVSDDVTHEAVNAAAREAIRRFASGDTRLAYTPHCGTSLLVGLTLFALIIVGCTVGAIVFGVAAASAFMAAAVLGVIAQVAWRPLGLAAQRMFTVSTRFAKADVNKVERVIDHDGLRTFDVACFVQL